MLPTNEITGMKISINQLDRGYTVSIQVEPEARWEKLAVGTLEEALNIARIRFTETVESVPIVGSLIFPNAEQILTEIVSHD